MEPLTLEAVEVEVVALLPQTAAGQVVQELLFLDTLLLGLLLLELD
jgi:hypothetical protein